jgi:DNA-binding FrmR family transcriptional regulator
MIQKHLSHPEVLARLKRAEGHLKSIIAMIEDDRSCMDVAQQLHAVEKAIATAKREHIHDHIEHCLEDGMDSKAGVSELKVLTKYL